MRVRRTGDPGLITTWGRDGVSAAWMQRSSARAILQDRSVLGASLHAQSATSDPSTPDNPQPEDPIASDPDLPRVAAVTCSTRWPSGRPAQSPREIRHRLVSIRALAAAAVIAGSRSYVATGQWASHASAGVLEALAVRVHPHTGAFVVPSESTI